VAPLLGAAERLVVAVNKPAATVSAVASYSRPYPQKLAHGWWRGKSIRGFLNFDFRFWILN
jgi:hypothetical protein